MSNLTHLWKVGQKIRYNCEGNWYKGEVKEVYPDHLIVDCPDISDHLWFESGLNLDCLYPEYNFAI